MKIGSNGTHEIGILYQQADGSVASCNKQAERILGYTAREMRLVLSQSPSQANQHSLNTHPALAFSTCRSFVTALTTGQPADDELVEFQRSDGSQLRLLLDSQPLFSESGDRPSGVVTTFKNITAASSDRHNNSQNSIEWQPDRDFLLLANAIPGIFYVYDVIARRYIYINDQTYSLLGYTPQAREVEPDFICQKMHPVDLKRFFTHVARLHQSPEGEVCKFEYRMRHQNGSWRWFCSQDWVSSLAPNGAVQQVLGIATDITQRKQTETALQKSEARLSENERLLRLALSNAKAGTWSWNIEQNEIIWSPENYDLYGSPQQKSLQYRDWEHSLHPDDIERSNLEIKKVLSGEKHELRIEFRIVHPQKGIRWLLGVGNITKNKAGKPIRLSGINIDISNQKQVEEALRHSKQQLRILLDTLPIFAGFLTTEGIVTEINQTALDSLALQPEDVLGRDFRDIYWWSYSTEIKAQIDRAIERAAAGETVRFDLVAIENDRYIIMDFGIVPKFNGEEVEYLIPFAIDVSDREASKQALQQRERELKLIAEVIPQQIWTAALDGHLDYINQRWRDYTGLDLKQMRQQGWASIVHPNDLSKVADAWIQAVKTGGEFNVKARLRRADGTYRWFLSQARPLRNEQDQIIKWYGTNTSIHKIKELEEKLLLQTKDLLQANRLKDQFLAIVSHELRTPLNPILGWSQLLAGGKLDRERTALGIAAIERNAKLQAQLVNDLLDVSQILRGTLKIDKISLDLSSVIKAALATVQSIAENKSIQIKSVFDPDVGRVLGDARRLQQIVWNLLSNAIKFTPKGGTVTVSLTEVETQAQIQVRDTGKGIEPEFLPYVFERFRQAQSSSTREFGGLGLGLAIVRHLTRLHGGTVTVESAGEGQGASFSVKLPLMNTSTEQTYQSTEESVQPNRFSGIEILVVDDEIDSLDILTLVLEQEGAKLTPVASAKAALDIFSQTTPDVIISDIGMPEVDGLTLMSQIRQLPEGKDVPAIALTAYAGEMDRQSSFDAGFQKHIAKPIDIPELIGAVTELLHHSTIDNEQ